MAYQVQNFVFETEEEAKRAQKEAQAIALIKTRLAASQPETALTIHKQLLEKELFTTKLGLAFMAEIRGDDTAIEAASSESADASDKSQATGATSKSKSKIRKNSKPSYRSE